MISSKCSHNQSIYHKSSLQKIYYLPLLSVCRNPSLNTSHLWNSWGFRLLLALIHCQKEQKNALLTRGKILEIYKNTRNIYLMLRVFLAFVVLGNKLQHLEPNKNQLCTFIPLACFIYFLQKFSVLRGTEISVIGPLYRNFCAPQYRKISVKSRWNKLLSWNWGRFWDWHRK